MTEEKKGHKSIKPVVEEHKNKDKWFSDTWNPAQRIGWTLDTLAVHGGLPIWYAKPPMHFRIVKEQWTMTFDKITYKDKTVLVPHLYWDDHVRMYGSHAPTTLQGICLGKMFNASTSTVLSKEKVPAASK